MSADDDLDALLDGALETMNANDAEMKEKEKIQQEANEETAQSLMSDLGIGAGGLPGVDGDMLKALGGLMSILQKGPDAMENASEAEMATIQAQLQSTLDQIKKHPDLSTEDQKQLGSMKNMMEHLNAMEKGSAPPEGAEEPALSEEEFNRKREELTKMLESMGAAGGLMGGAGGGGPNLPPFPFSSMPTSSSAASSEGQLPQPESEEEACRQVFEMTLGLLKEKDIELPFTKLKAAYGPWLAANAGSLSLTELERIRNQARMADEMCQFFVQSKMSEILQEGSKATTEERAAVLEQFGTLMSELHSYGEAPADLFAENQEAQ